MSLSTLQGFLGLAPSSPTIQAYLAQLSPSSPLDPEIKTYADVMYVNYHALGISFCCVPAGGGARIDQGAGRDGVLVESIDLYNPRPTAGQGRSRKRAWSVFKGLPLVLEGVEGQVMRLEEGTRGRDIVAALGEPSRKGGGTGWVDVWLEYANVGVVLDLQDPRGDEIVSEAEQAKGIGGMWDRAGRWVWSSVKVFKPTEEGDQS